MTRLYAAAGAEQERHAMRGDSHDKVMDSVTEAFRASPYGRRMWW